MSRPRTTAWWGLIALTSIVTAGCTSARQWVANGFQVGPEYCPPAAAVADNWIDADDRRVRSDVSVDAAWWTVFDDPQLSELVALAYQQNLSLREAGARILEARALRAIAVGSVFPQRQQMAADYRHNLVPGEGFDRHFSIWSGEFNLAWEIDFWGRFRRAVEATDADLDAAVEDYGDVLVTLIADVAATYVDIRTRQRRIELVNQNVDTQRRTYELAEIRFREGDASEIDVHQAKSSLEQTRAFVPQLETALRQSQIQLCVLLGIPPQDVSELLGEADIPTAPVDVAVGIPAELLSRRPDVRRAERRLAAQSARIGVAESELYPQISLTGTIGVTGNQFRDLFRSGASFGTVGPSFRWNVLNYGRIVNNVRAEDALFRNLLYSYRQAVLLANAEAESALVFFLRSQTRLESQMEAALAARKTNDLIVELYAEGEADFNRVFNVQNFKTRQEEEAALAKGDVAIGLIELYRALGGGWPTWRCGGLAAVQGQPAINSPPSSEVEEIPRGDVSQPAMSEQETILVPPATEGAGEQLEYPETFGK